MWTLILICVHLNNPKDIPGIVRIDFPSYNNCIEASKSIEYKLKFENFKVTSECKEKSLLSPITLPTR